MDEIKFGAPTFIFRDECEDDLLGILEGISKAGFAGAELFGLFGNDAKDIKKGIDQIGIKVMGDHIPYDEFTKEADRVIDDHVILGTPFITIDRIPEDKLPGNPGFSEAVKQIEIIGRKCKEAGMRLLYHNHGYDLTRKIEGKYALETLLDTVSPEGLSFQPDIGWLMLGGGESGYFLDKYKDRCPVIHLKDFYASKPTILESPHVIGRKRGGASYNDFEFRPTGYGVVNFPSLMKQILACNPKWIVADHDMSYERDGMKDMRISLEYVKNLVNYSMI